MLRLLDRILPAVRLARDLAVTRERLSCAEARNTDLAHEHAILQARYDRLVESRLFRTGDISEPLSSPSSPSRLSSGSFGTGLGAIFAPVIGLRSTPTPVEDAPVAG